VAKTQSAYLGFYCNKGYANTPHCYISNRSKTFRTAQLLRNETPYTLGEENAVTEKLKIKEVVTDTFILGREGGGGERVSFCYKISQYCPLVLLVEVV
jgi:hypothetical protein